MTHHSNSMRGDADGAGSLTAAIHDASDPLIVMRRVVEQALGLIPAAEGAVVELVCEGQLTYVCASGTLTDYVGVRLGIEESLSGLAVRTGETLYCENSATDTRVDHEACRKVGAVSMVCVPLRRGDEPIGVLKIIAKRPRAFATRDVTVLAGLADFISAIIGAVSDISRTAGELFEAPAAGEDATHKREDEVRTGVRARSAGEGISEFVANVLRPGIVADLAVKRRIERVLAERSLTILCQPIIDLHTGELLGAEALARFPHPPQQPPDVWFKEAEQTGLSVQLQLVAVQTALKVLDQLPANAFLAVNVGPDAITAPELPVLLESTDCERIVLELTEHLRIDDYPHLRTVLRAIRSSGVRLAIDDTGAGFASLSHLINLAPDLVKLDREFTRGIDLDPVRRALAHALVSFAQDTGADVIAEGIETSDELNTIRQLGIPNGQGYFIGRPQPIASVRQHFEQAKPGAVHGY